MQRQTLTDSRWRLFDVRIAAMHIDWMVVATIAGPIIGVFVGVWANQRFERRANLISYYGHVSAFQIQTPNGGPMGVHTHAVVLKNAGKQSATNVRLRHAILPDFTIYPPLQHTVENVPGGSREIVIPTLVPAEEITVSYLYFPPVTAVDVNAGIRCNQGFARPIPVLLQRQYSNRVQTLLGVLLLAGIVATAYVVVLICAAVIRLLR